MELIDDMELLKIVQKRRHEEVYKVALSILDADHP